MCGHGIRDQKYLKSNNEDDGAPQTRQHPELHSYEKHYTSPNSRHDGIIPVPILWGRRICKNSLRVENGRTVNPLIMDNEGGKYN